MYLVKLVRYFTWPHHRLTALLYFYMRACKCQLFTDEGSRRLPKCLNYCFSVLASATNRSRWQFIKKHGIVWLDVDKVRLSMVTSVNSIHTHLVDIRVQMNDMVEKDRRSQEEWTTWRQTHVHHSIQHHTQLIFYLTCTTGPWQFIKKHGIVWLDVDKQVRLPMVTSYGYMATKINSINKIIYMSSITKGNIRF